MNFIFLLSLVVHTKALDLKTHFVFSKDNGFKKLESKDIQITLSIDSQLNDTLTLLDAYLTKTKDLFKNQAWKDVSLNPAFGYSKVTKIIIQATIDKLHDINAHMNTTLADNFKRSASYCTYDLTLFQGT